MHELSLCKSIIDIVEQYQTDAVVKSILVEIGQLTGIKKQVLMFNFDIIKSGTVVAEAQLHIIEIAGKAHCASCKRIFAIHHYGEACSYCGSYAVTVIQGEEFRIKSMEVE